MAKRLTTLFAIILTVVLIVPVIPASAQEGTTIPVPAPCTDEERQAMLDLLASIQEQVNEAREVVAEPETMADYVNAALLLKAAQDDLNSAEGVPFCTDTAAVMPMFGNMLSNTIIALQQTALYLALGEDADAEFLEQLGTYSAFHVEQAVTYQTQLETILPAAMEGPVVPEWFALCTPDDLSSDAYTQLAGLEAWFAEQSEAIDALFADGTVTSELLFGVEDVLMAWEAATTEMSPCHEAYFVQGIASEMYYELAMTLGWNVLIGADAELDDALTEAYGAAVESLTSTMATYQTLSGTEAEAE